MKLRYLSTSFLVLYALLTAVILLRAILGAPFLRWIAIVLPVVGVAFGLAHAASSLGWRRAGLFFGLSVAISLLFECVGVATGWIYGPYYYTQRLGPLFLGLVPSMIPFSWFMMAYPAYVIAERLAPAHWRARWLGVAALGGLAMVAWDLVMDPLMVLRGHWVWQTPGAYFGIPLQNYWGWWLTTFVILVAYQALAGRISSEPIQSVQLSTSFARLAVLSYALTGLGNVADAWLAGLPGPALVGGAALLVFTCLGWGYKAKIIASL